jgi:hypothetical protein
MTSTRFLDPGSPLVSTVQILKGNTMIKVVTPDTFRGTLRPGTFGRIESQKNDFYNVWLLDESTMSTVIIEVPAVLMGQYFRQHPHGIFPHLTRT